MPCEWTAAEMGYANSTKSETFLHPKIFEQLDYKLWSSAHMHLINPFSLPLSFEIELFLREPNSGKGTFFHILKIKLI